MHRILPVLRLLLFVSLAMIVIGAGSGCGLKGDLVLPDDEPGPAEATEAPAPDDAGPAESEDERAEPGTRRG